MKSEITGRVALTVSCASIALVAGTIGVLMMPALRLKLGLAPVPTPSYAVGATVDVPAPVYDGAPHTLIVFARSNCPACQRMKPSLVDLISALEKHTETRAVMVTGGSQLSDEIQYAAELGLARDRVVPLTASTRKLRQVPTLVLVNRQGKVLASEEGAPPNPDPGVIARMVALVQPR